MAKIIAASNCELKMFALTKKKKFLPQIFSSHFVKYFKKQKNCEKNNKRFVFQHETTLIKKFLLKKFNQMYQFGNLDIS